MYKVVLEFEFETEEDKDFFFEDLDSREDLNYASYVVKADYEEED